MAAFIIAGRIHMFEIKYAWLYLSDDFGKLITTIERSFIYCTPGQQRSFLKCNLVISIAVLGI